MSLKVNFYRIGSRLSIDFFQSEREVERKKELNLSFVKSFNDDKTSRMFFPFREMKTSLFSKDEKDHKDVV